MTRRSKRELERAVEDLVEETESSTSDETFADRHYSEGVRDFVYQVVRDTMVVTHNHELVNLNNPERTRRHLKSIRETYGIDDDRDDAVHSALRERAAEVQSKWWGPCDALSAAMVLGPALLSGDDREQFDELLDRGGEEQAAAMIVDAVYNELADRGSRRAAMPAEGSSRDDPGSRASGEHSERAE